MSQNFSNKGTLADTVKELIANPGKAKSIPPILIYERNGKVYTLDHRRLTAARIAGVPVHFKKLDRQINELDQRKWDNPASSNDGMAIAIR